MQVQRIFVTGYGIISPIGTGKAENHTSLKNGGCGIGHLDQFPTRYASLLPFGEIKVSDDELRERLHVSEKGITRTTLLALAAFGEAIDNSGLIAGQLASYETALINGNTVGGMCLTDELYQDSTRASGGSSFLNDYDCGSVNIYLQKKYGIAGVINTINTACSSSANAIMYGARLIKHGLARRAIVGGVDSLAKFTINGFNALMILADAPCRPFDKDRKGLNLGEGAAFLVLEGEKEATGKRVYAELTGYANSNDAFHPSSLSDDGVGPHLAMKAALSQAGLSPEDIDYINAHGTGTENNDEVESRAMMRLFGNVPPFSSTKANTGHTLGASGAIEAIFSILALENQEIYPHLHFSSPIQSTGLTPALSYRQAPLRHVMSNSFGFGGNCSSLIFSKV